ncbi:hypothetical protein [Rhodococcus marinonascens]|uniref:hypothetical protein n=1 Tax=Rhodococcus marinonascens TaxID=38311 RepID=UPI000A00DA10|nr:hypothetical protein [Rhodococcus marinonascens]
MLPDVECCPTSNWFTGGIPRLAAHPTFEDVDLSMYDAVLFDCPPSLGKLMFRTFRDSGVAVVLGDDNPRQTLSPKSAERTALSAELGFTGADLLELDRTSVAAAFAEESTRALLNRKLPLPAPHS